MEVRKSGPYGSREDLVGWARKLSEALLSTPGGAAVLYVVVDSLFGSMLAEDLGDLVSEDVARVGIWRTVLGKSKYLQIIALLKAHRVTKDDFDSLISVLHEHSLESMAAAIDTHRDDVGI